MSVRWLWVGIVSIGAIVLVTAQAPVKTKGPAPSLSLEERLARHRNLGKAFYENPTTQQQAVEEFAKALKLAPASQRERLNYGLALLRAGKSKEAFAEIEAVQKADPKLPHTYWNLAVELKKQGEHERALQQINEFVKLVPNEAISRYNQGVLLKLASKPVEAIAAFERAAQLDANLAAARFQLFNAYRQAGRQADSQRMLAEFQRLKKQAEGSATPEDVDWNAYSEIYEVIEPAKAAAELKPVPLKFEDTVLGDGYVGVAVANGAVVAWSKTALRSFPAGVPSVEGVVDAASGDFNNDGVTDLAVVTSDSAILIDGAAKSQKALAAGKWNKAVWLDYDHDYDLDLLLLGGESKLYRNQGQAGFVDRTADFPFVKGEAVGAVVYRVVPDTRGMDLTVSYKDRGSVLYRDMLSGVYKAEPVNAPPTGALDLAAADTNHDGKYELSWRIGGKPPLFADPDRQGYLRANLQDQILGGVTAWAVADWDRDGREDYAAITADGKLHKLLNRTATQNNWISVKLTGVKNLLTSPHAEVEVKAGTLYQKKLYTGEPLLFGLRNLTAADTVRITWPNGLIQNEPNQAANKVYTYKEAQRLSGSCPIIWTWDGSGFRYITDVLGVAPLGAAAGDGKYFETDHDEYVFLDGDALRERDGELEIRMTEELSEVAFLDQVKLLAVDHPAEISLYHNDKWKSPPYPEHRLWGVRKRIAPVAAVDDQGNDVRAKLLAKDRTYPDAFPRTMSNLAAKHSLTVRFPETAARDGKAVLVLSGWVDWADGSTFLSASQEDPQGLIAPQLQMKNAKGQWETVMADMGMPAGKPKSIVVDVSGKWLSASREIRIVTNMCVYWDEIFLSEETEKPLHVSSIPPMTRAELDFRGFSPNKVHPERKQPEEFYYDHPDPVSLWNPTPGKYTRYGDVARLLSEADDRMVVMGSGDEVRMKFSARALPPLQSGWKRDYLLLVDGWAKDRDANTAHSQNVNPLPFHRMSGYPFHSSESHPDASYQREYNTRPALRLIRPLVP